MRLPFQGAVWASLLSLLLPRCTRAGPTSANVGARLEWTEDLAGRKAPAMMVDFPDPSLFTGGEIWYAFGTSSTTNGTRKLVQYATAPQPTGPWTYVSEDLLRGNAGAWTDQHNIWAPDVHMVDDGTYVMYYTAALSTSYQTHCLGVATADTITGPWTVQDAPWQCERDAGGNIDSSGFQDSNGKRWVVYKIDGNARGHGGECGNTVAPIRPTPIMLQRVAGDGRTKMGEPVQILDRTKADGPLVEAPNMIRARSGLYVLFYSSHCWTDVGYNVQYATATSVQGPYTRHGASFLETGAFQLTSPGGGTSSTLVGDEDNVMLFHANCPAPVGGSNRCMFVSTFTETGTSMLANR